MSLRTNRSIAFVLALVSAVTVLFTTLVPTAANAATVTLTVKNLNPLADPYGSFTPATSDVAPGDTVLITTSGTMVPSSTTFTFPGHTDPVSASAPNDSTPATAFTVQVPSDAVSGTLTATDGTNNGSTTLKVWVSRSEPYKMPAGHLNITYGDLKYILDQIKIGEAHSARTSKTSAQIGTAAATPTNAAGITYPYDLTSATRCLQAADVTSAASATYGSTGLSNPYIYSNLEPLGVRQVDGQCNNISNVKTETVTPPTITGGAATTTNLVVNTTDTGAWGSADQSFLRLAPTTLIPTSAAANYTGKFAMNATQKSYQLSASQLGFVTDPQTRIISNIISDQTEANPAATQASKDANNILYGNNNATHEIAVNATTGVSSRVNQIPNITPDYNVSAGFNSWFTLFGQFFDHGLDLIPKNYGSVFIPVTQGDPIYQNGGNNFMVLSRGANATDSGSNITTPWVDQSQTYGSHASQNFFLRQYKLSAGKPFATGKMLEGTDRDVMLAANATDCYATNSCVFNGGLATWRDVKNQAKFVLGIGLSDYDVSNIPVIATDQYGKFIRNATTGMPYMLMYNSTTSQYQWKSGTTGLGVLATGTGTNATWKAVGSGHPFINDTMAGAVPWSQSGTPLLPDADSIIESSTTTSATYYDDEGLAEHYIAGDGRVNENIGLSAVHNTFHSEHNLLVDDLKGLIQNNPVATAAFQNEWHATGGTWTTAGQSDFAVDANWNGERLYQAARFVDEMEYQHMVFDEFIRRISPNLPVFLAYNPSLNPGISQEFASAVYRLGHSMLNETIARSNPGSLWSADSNQDVALLTAFTNPAQARMPRPVKITDAASDGSSVTYNTAAGETEPTVGNIVSISNLNNSAFNLSNAIVDSVTSNSFTVKRIFTMGASAGSTTVSVASGTTDSKQDVDGNDIAGASYNDPGYALGITGEPNLSAPLAYNYTSGQAAAMIAQGMSQQRANEIDEFVTDAVRNNLFGLPLDLASLNLTRGRDVGLPTLNQFRSKFASSLPPYKSWQDYIGKMRYQSSAVNFLAAYGTHPTLTSKTVTAATRGAYTSGQVVTYTVADSSSLHVGDVVSISGFAGVNAAKFNFTNAVVKAVPTATTFTVERTKPHAPSAVVAFSSSANQMTDYGTMASPTGGTLITSQTVGLAAATASGSITREPTIAEKRAAATAILAKPSSVSDATQFLTSTGAWATAETGIDNVDLWIGGLAENPGKQPITPSMLGPTFQKVFDDQMTKLQNGDRFYYLGRFTGTNLNEEIPAQKLTDIVRRNTPSVSSTSSTNQGILGMNSPGFGVTDCFWTSDPSTLLSGQTSPDIASDVACDPNTQSTDGVGGTQHSGLDNTVGFGLQSDTKGINVTAGDGDDSVQGTAGPDKLSGGIGGDLIDGYAGDDILSGGGGEDLLKGGAGNDVIDAGESQLGDIADGGSGVDYIHNGDASGAVASFIGEAGDDFIQGGKGSDILLEGGEGDDWVEGGAGIDALTGDLGLFPGGGEANYGGDDVLNGGAEADLLAGDGGQDIMLLGTGAGVDGAAGGTGFDWANYEYNQRFDNGQTTVPSAYVDLSGVIPNPLNMPADGLADIEGLAGGPGNDQLFGSLASNFRVAAGGASTSKVGSVNLVLNGTYSNIASGMQVTGTGIPAGAQVVGAGTIATVGVVTTTTVPINMPITAPTTGIIDFKVWPMNHIANQPTIAGMYDLVKDQPAVQIAAASGANPALNAGYDSTTDTWTGGSIMLGGAGNDTLTVSAGTNIVHGSAALHTCISVTHNGVPFKLGADVPCGSSLGYSSMTALNQYMSDGTLNPSDLRIVRELRPTSVNVTAVTVSGGSTVYTTENNILQVGDRVTVSGITNTGTNAGVPVDNVNNVVITAANATSFTVATPTGGVSVATASGKAVATDTLALPLAQTSYRVEQLSVLPIGASSGYRFIELGATNLPTGNSIVAYDVQMVSFAAAAAVTTASAASAASQVGLTNLTPMAIGGVVNAEIVPVGSSARINGAIHNYLALAATGATQVQIGFVRNGVVTSVQLSQNNGTAWVLVSGTTSQTPVLNLANGRTILLRVNKGGLTLDYKITVLANGVGLAPSFDTPRPIAGGFTTNITNCDPLDFNYTATVNGNAVGYTAVQSAGSGQCLVTVSGLTAGQAATLAVTATPKVGSLPSLPAPATASVSAFAGSSLATAPVLTSVVRNIGGFTATIANYDPTNYTYSVSSSAPGSAATDNGSVTATSIDVNVTGLADGGSATLSVTATSKFGLGSATTLIVGTAQANNVVTPTLASKDAPSTVDANTRTFSVKITNYNASYDYSCDVLATDILFAAVPDSCTLTTSGSDHIMTFVINVSTGTTGDIWHYLVVAGKNGQYSNSNSIDYTLGDAGSYLVN